MSDLTAKMETSKGTINITLFADQTPYTVSNFVNLIQRGYYDGLKFHRVIADFMVQGGCPQGTGTGGPGYNFEDEIADGLTHHKPGMLSMANAGPNTNGSQFFITHVPCSWLDGKHAVFGEVLTDQDMDIVNSIAQGDTITAVTVEGDVAALMAQTQAKVDEWNAILDK